MQVSGSFLITFASIDFPPAFSGLVGTMSGIVSFDMVNTEMFGEAVSDLNYCNMTISVMMTACVGFAGFPTSWAYLQHF